MTKITYPQDYFNSANFKELLSETSGVPGTDLDWITYEKESSTFFITEFKKLNPQTKTFQISKPQLDLLIALEEKLPNSVVTIWIVENYVTGSHEDPVWTFKPKEILQHKLNIHNRYEVSVTGKEFDFVCDMSKFMNFDFYEIAKLKKSRDFILK